MGTYFKPLRRKLGVFVLFLAFLFAAGWLRGHFVGDTWYPAAGTLVDANGVMHRYIELRGWQSVTSSKYGITWEYGGLSSARNSRLGVDNSTRPLELTNQREMARESRIRDAIRWRIDWCGFDFFDAETTDYRNSRRKIPYWFPVLSLTLISAYLLLSKPRASRLNPTTVQ